MNRIMDIAGRVLLAGLFLAGTIQKVIDPAAVEGLLAGRGLPEVLVWPAAALNLAIAVLLVIGWRLRVMAMLAAAYCGATSVFHLIPDDSWQMSIFIKNWAIAGGLLCLAARAGTSTHASAIGGCDTSGRL